MSKKHNLFSVVKWQDICSEVALANPKLASFINEFEPKDDFDFVKASYHYGQKIIHDGKLHLPVSKSQTIKFDDEKINKNIQNRLKYSNVPVAIILNKKCEVYYENELRVMPTKVFNKGSMFGLWEMFDLPPDEFVESIWNITAGSRSIFMLPKISNQISHKLLQSRFNIASYPPSNLLQHHAIFSELACSEQARSQWKIDVIFFSKKWASTLDDKSEKNIKLNYFFLREAWRQSLNCRTNMSFDMAWELFSNSVTKRNIKPKPIIVNSLKHLLAISDGFYPGYAPAVDEESAPLELLYEAYSEVYKINALPCIMEPVHLSEASRPVYYSLQLPTLLEYAPGASGKNIITDLRELKMLSDMFINTDKNQKYQLQYFHAESDPQYGIRSADVLPELDQNFSMLLQIHNKKFPANSPFFKGCVQVSLKSNRKEPLAVDAVF